ncbi:unnamed protein product [Lampetra fluviatilis]
MAVIMALIAVFIATVALSSTASSLPVSGKLSPSDEAALKCIIEVLSGALSPAQPPPAASAECMEILHNRISTLIHQHDLLSQLEEIAGRGPAGERAGADSTAAGAKYEPSEERQETKEEVEDDEETRVDHEEKDKKDAKKKKKQQQQQENDDDDDDEKEQKEDREEGGDDETKSGVGKSREFRTKGPGSAERRAGGAGGGGGTKWSGGRVRVEPRHGEAPPEKATGRERSNGEEPRGQMHGPPDTGDEEEEEEERSPHHEDKDDVGDEVARSVGTGVDDDEVEEEDADVEEEEVTETPARRGDTRPQRGSHGTSGVERSAAREAHDGRRRPAAEQLLEYLDQIRQRLGQKQQEQQQQQEQQRRRGDYGGRHPDKGEPLAERKSDGEDDDDDGDDEKVEYETRKSEVGGRHGHDEVEDDAREQEEDNDRTDDDDAEGEEQVGGEEVFGDGVGSSHRWAGKAHAEGRPAWGAAHRAAAKGDEVEDAAQGGDGEEGDEEKEQEQEEVGRGGGKEWGGDKRAQDTQSRKHSTLNSKQLLELKAMEHELVKIAERLGERLG